MTDTSELKKTDGAEALLAPVGLATLRRLIELDARKRELDRKLKATAAEMAALQEPLVDWFAQQGIQRIACDGRTCYLRRDIFAGLAEDKDAAIEILERSNETAWLVAPAVNAQRLSAWVREQPRDEQGAPVLPERLRGHVVVRDKFTIGLRAE